MKAGESMFKFITENQSHETREKDPDKDLLKTFEKTNGVSYNKGNLTFNIKPGFGELWIKCLAKKLSDPVLLPNGSGYKMKVEEFKIPSVTYLTKKTYGSLTVTVWPNPSDGQPKVCVQGTMYLAFISFVLPGVLKDVAASKALDCTHGDDDLTEDGCSDLGKVNGKLKRLEKEVLNVSNMVVSKVDIALSNINKSEPDVASLVGRIENLEEILKTNQEQFATLAESVEKLNSTILTQGAVRFLARSFKTHKTLLLVSDDFRYCNLMLTLGTFRNLNENL